MCGLKNAYIIYHEALVSKTELVVVCVTLAKKMANDHVKKQQQIAITPETVVLPKPKPRSSKSTTTRDEDHLYASLRITQQTDDANEPLHFDTKLQSHESEATAFYSELEQVVERGHIKLPTSEGREINEKQDTPHAGGQAKEEQTSKDTKMWKVCSSKWRMITFVALITASLCILLVFAIATVGLSRANSAVESE